MQLHLKRADMHAYPKANAHTDILDRLVRRFRPELRNAVQALSMRHSRLADLAYSFPALLAALACPRAHFSPEPIITHVIAGAPLAEIAHAAAVPMWLRKIRPELVPDRVPILPDGAMFHRQIANHLPCHAKDASDWFALVANTHLWTHQDIALWCAREFMRDRNSDLNNRWRLISLWAWFSRAPGTYGYTMIGQRFAFDMAFKAAWASALDWCDSVELYLEMGDKSVDDVWLRPGMVMEYEFVPLRTHEEMAEEAQRMKHCLRRYGAVVAQGYSRVWSIRREGERLATAEVYASEDNPWPQIKQIRIAENKNAPEEIWLAAHSWLRSHDLSELKRNCAKWDNQLRNRKAWVSLWRPYWIAKQRIPAWLGLQPSWETLNQLAWYDYRRRRGRWR